MAILTLEDRAIRYQEQAAHAVAAARLLAALIPALSAAEGADYISGDVHSDIRQMTAELRSTVRGYVEKFAGSL
jgi:hypothetical protein